MCRLPSKEDDHEIVYMLCDARTGKATRCAADRSCLARVGDIGFVSAASDAAHHMVVELYPNATTGRATLRRFSTELGAWVSDEVRYPPRHRPWGSNGFVTHDGKLWWVDLAYGLLSCEL